MKTWMKLLLFGMLLFAATPAFSQVRVRVRVAPPPVRREVVVARPYAGAVWVAGHYDWRPRRADYVWVPGRWVRAPRANAVWVEPRWDRDGDGYAYYKGYWR